MDLKYPSYASNAKSSLAVIYLAQTPSHRKERMKKLFQAFVALSLTGSVIKWKRSSLDYDDHFI